MTDAADTLSTLLRRAREKHHLSLRSVEDETGISNAYLSQLEHDRIRQPSPVILHKLSELYGLSYPEVMGLAGYPVPTPKGTDDSRSHRGRFARLGDVTDEEAEALAEYLQFLRTRRERTRR